MEKQKKEKKMLEVCSEIEKASRQLHLKQALLRWVEPEPDEYESKVGVSVISGLQHNGNSLPLSGFIQLDTRAIVGYVVLTENACCRQALCKWQRE